MVVVEDEDEGDEGRFVAEEGLEACRARMRAERPGSREKRRMKGGCCWFQEREEEARARFSAEEERTEPEVCSSEFMKETRAVRMVETVHEGCHVSGWKSENEKQIGASGLNRPDGVFIRMDGGLYL